ncbi:MAG: chloride channel protein [Mariprofundaceae bacterium]
MAFKKNILKGQVQFLAWIHGHDTVYLGVLAVVVGVVAGYAALILRFSIEWVSLLWTGERAWDAALGNLPWYVYLMAPTLAGLAVGWLVSKALPGEQLRGVSGVLADLVERNGHINRRQMYTETLGTSLAAGSGASLGREGPTVALGAVIASEIGNRFGLTEQQLRTLIGCGVAAGIAASFNTPIAGVLFALEVILADYAIATFSPIVIASVLATVITRSEVGNFPAFTVPEYHLISAWEIIAYIGIGAVCGIIATILIKSLGPVRKMFVRFVPNAMWRPALAGFLLGLLGLVLPQIMSIGYGTVESMLLERIDSTVLGTVMPVAGFLALVLFGKLIATILCHSGGFPGGLFGPTLFLGATVGALLGGIAHEIFPAYSETYGAYALVACGALAAAALQAPLTVILIVFEMTGDYHIMVPLMAAVSVATAVKRAFGRDSVFTEVLEERGIETEWGREQSWMRSVYVSRIPWRAIPSVYEHAKLEELKRIYVDSGKGCVQVVDDDENMVGIITFNDLQQCLLDSTLDQVVVAGEIANRNVRVIPENGSLLEAIRVFDREGFEQMPVVAKDNPRKVLGVLARNTVFSIYHKLIVKHGEHSR